MKVKWVRKTELGKPGVNELAMAESAGGNV